MGKRRKMPEISSADICLKVPIFTTFEAPIPDSLSEEQSKEIFEHVKRICESSLTKSSQEQQHLSRHGLFLLSKNEQLKRHGYQNEIWKYEDVLSVCNYVKSKLCLRRQYANKSTVTGRITSRLRELNIEVINPGVIAENCDVMQILKPDFKIHSYFRLVILIEIIIKLTMVRKNLNYKDAEELLGCYSTMKELIDRTPTM